MSEPNLVIYEYDLNSGGWSTPEELTEEQWRKMHMLDAAENERNEAHIPGIGSKKDGAYYMFTTIVKLIDS